MELCEDLKLKNQLCFPLYSVSNLITRKYKPLLDELDLTYTQYIAMMSLWETGDCSESELGKRLYLKSNTLTPLLKKLKQKGYVSMKRNAVDGRSIMISLTPTGNALKEKAAHIPSSLARSLNLSADEGKFLYAILYKILKENYHEEL
ncbi:MAG: MarR family transcriptional regulator [Bacilli bacterium]|nr:MarR family transcriptional regulator [Bacilli bacterium]